MTPPQRFFDLQVNGYGGVDFNQDDLSAEDLHRACDKLASDGVEGFLPTIITERIDKMAARIGRLAQLRQGDPLVRRLVAGIHIEGPFLSPADGYRGAHPLDAVLSGDVGVMERLLEAGDGHVRLVTLAPECDAGLKVTRLLAKRGVVIAAGHTDASLAELHAAADAGLTLFTHVGNGCPAVLPRHDNIVQRALSLPKHVWLTFIADGAHVPMFALGNYLRCAGLERCLVVTDAIAPAGLGKGHFQLARWELDIGADLVARSPDGSHLVGSVGTMERSFANLVSEAGLSQTEARQLTWDNPRRALSIADSV
jgi:N-acetylglucosamine-6-phosphate deacetylase